LQKEVGGPKFFQCFLARTPASFCPKRCFLVSYCPSPSCIANLNLLTSMAGKINTESQFFLDAPLAQTPASFCHKSCFLVSYCPSPTCIPNFKLLASMVAEINRGSQIFLDAPLCRTRTPANFGRKSCFLASYFPSQSCTPNLKSLASMIAEINRGSQIFTCSPSSDPIKFGLESCFW